MAHADYSLVEKERTRESGIEKVLHSSREKCAVNVTEVIRQNGGAREKEI